MWLNASGPSIPRAASWLEKYSREGSPCANHIAFVWLLHNKSPPAFRRLNAPVTVRCSISVRGNLTEPSPSTTGEGTTFKTPTNWLLHFDTTATETEHISMDVNSRFGSPDITATHKRKKTLEATVCATAAKKKKGNPEMQRQRPDQSQLSRSALPQPKVTFFGAAHQAKAF